jgi:hypothetical protein
VLGGGSLRGCLVDIAHGDDVGAGLAKTWDMVVGHPANANDSDFETHVFESSE